MPEKEKTMLTDLSKQLLDARIDRRAFIRGVTAGGVSVAGAGAIADALGVQAAAAAVAAPAPGRVLNGLTGGELNAEFLLDWNVPYVFGLAGSEEVGFLDALVDRDGLQYVTCLHENVAMAMADGYARASGQTSFVQLHSVAGAAFALGQLVNSYRDRVPVVVAVGRQASDFRGHDGFLEAANLHELPRDYSQWIWDVMSPDTIPEVLRRAFLLAEAPPGGPAFLTFSKDFWEKRVDVAEITPRTRSAVEYDVAPPDAHVKAVADALVNADMPMLYLGNEGIRWEVTAEVAAIAEAVGASVTTASKIPLLFPTTHPHYLGQFMDDAALAERTDVFWSLGGHMFKTGLKPPKPLLGPGTTIMHTGLDDSEVGRSYPVDLAAIAGIKATAAAVLDELRGRNLKGRAIAERRRWLAEQSDKRRAALAEAAKGEWNNTPIATSRLMRELNAVIGADAHIVSEIVSSDQYMRYYLDIDHRVPAEKRRRNFDTTGGVLGWGVAAAVGVKIAHPQRETWCLSGDGAFNFSCQALWSAARYEVPVGVVIFNNGQYQSNRRFLHWYGGRAAATGKYVGSQLGHPDIDYIALSRAYGVEAERVEAPDGIAPALQRARRAILEEKRPYLVDVRIERRYGGADSEWYDHFSVAKMASGAQ